MYPNRTLCAYSLFFAFVPHCIHKLSAPHRKRTPSSASLFQSYTSFSQRTSPTQVKRCSSIVPFCSAKTYLQGCNKLLLVALAYSIHLPVGLRSSRCSPPAVHLFCFTHFSHSSLAAISSPQTPIKCSLYSQKNKIGGLSLHEFGLACGSLRANRAVMLFAINPVPTVASFHTSTQPLSAPHTRVAHSLHSTFHHYNSFAIDAYTGNPHLVNKTNYQMLCLHINTTICLKIVLQYSVSFNRYTCLSRP